MIGKFLRLPSPFLAITLTALATFSLCTFGLAQANGCKVEIVRLKFDKNFEHISQRTSGSLLASAELSGDVLVHNSAIKKFQIKLPA